MIDLITVHRQSIEDFCRTYGVSRLDVFGSAATGVFDPAASDIDFIVDLGDYIPGTVLRYLDLINDLEDLLGHPVQMITEPSIRNPLFREAVDEQRVTIYEARNREAAAQCAA